MAILILGEEKELADILSINYEITNAKTPEDALNAVSKGNIDAVVAPYTEGDVALIPLLTQGANGKIPLFVISEGNEAHEKTALEYGATDILAKPFHEKIVLNRVKNALNAGDNSWEKAMGEAQGLEIQKLQKAMEMDPLTGLLNRASFYKKCAEILKNTDKQYSVVYFDISCFKVLNDLFNMDTGNLVLTTAGVYFQTIDKDALAARFDADHFLLFIETEKLDMDRVMYDLDRHIETLNINHKIRFFAGIYNVTDKTVPINNMCDGAHIALNKIKGSYVTRYAYYDKSLREIVIREQTLVRDMEIALVEKQFKVFMQAIYDTKEKRITAAEALVRWEHPTLGQVPPNDFVPLFERNGFVVRLDRYVWEEVAKFLRAEWDSFGKVIPVSVNVSHLNFYNRDLLDYLLSLVEKYELEPSMIKLEIMETAYMDEPEKIIAMINEFRAHGFEVMLDDFGSGHSSLSMLKNLPVDVLKIDISFTQEAGSSKRVNAILKFIMNLSEELKMDVIVEGVETKEQLEVIQKLGCHQIQGYYFGKPMPKDDFMRTLDEQFEREKAK
ncbi:MAG: EAL domain-containing protein [Selenomonadaceae bacterium]|nr:EAL domain-containing protein [Selenomonadaceae bacterium]